MRGGGGSGGACGMGWGTVIGAWGKEARTPSGLGGGGRARGPCTPRKGSVRVGAAPHVRRAVARFPDRFSQRWIARCGGGAAPLRGAVLPGRRWHGSGDPCHAEGGRSTRCGRSRRRRRAERARLLEGATGAVEKFYGRAGKILGRRAALQPPREVPECGLKHRATPEALTGSRAPTGVFRIFGGAEAGLRASHAPVPLLPPASLPHRRYAPARLGPRAAARPVAPESAVVGRARVEFLPPPPAAREPAYAQAPVSDRVRRARSDREA